MLPKLSVTFTCCGTLVNVSEMSPELLRATTPAAASPVTEMVPKLSWRRRLPGHAGRLDVAGIVVQLDAAGQVGSGEGAEAVCQADVPGQPGSGQVSRVVCQRDRPMQPAGVQFAERIADADRQSGRDGNTEFERAGSGGDPALGIERQPAAVDE
jgi:hypothetical protein